MGHGYPITECQNIVRQISLVIEVESHAETPEPAAPLIEPAEQLFGRTRPNLTPEFRAVERRAHAPWQRTVVLEISLPDGPLIGSCEALEAIDSAGAVRRLMQRICSDRESAPH